MIIWPRKSLSITRHFILSARSWTTLLFLICGSSIGNVRPCSLYVDLTFGCSECATSSQRRCVRRQRSTVTGVLSYLCRPFKTQRFNHGSRQQLRGWLATHTSYVCTGRKGGGGIVLTDVLFLVWRLTGLLGLFLDLLCHVVGVLLFAGQS